MRTGPKKGHKQSEETKRKRALSQTGEKNHRWGTHHTEEWKQRMSKLMKGKNSPSWKGGKTIDKDGYILISITEHPNANGTGYVREHRLIVEKKIGRYLTRDEQVHHINGIKNDNRLKNLYLFSSNSDHIKFEGLKVKPIIISNLTKYEILNTINTIL